MLVQHPFEDIEFELPDEWIELSGATGFRPYGAAFLASSDPQWPTVGISISKIEAPIRGTGFTGLHRDRAISILHAMASSQILPPLEVHQKPSTAFGKLSVRDGYHRYYLSIALGFTMLPVSVRPYFDFNAI